MSRMAWLSDFSVHVVCSWLMGSLSKPVDSLSLGGGSAVSLLLVMGRKEESLVTLGTGTKGGLLRMFKHPSLDNPTLPAPLLPSLGKSAVPLHLASSTFP